MTYAGDDSLADGDTDRTTERTDEEERGRARRHVLQRHRGLQPNKRCLRNVCRYYSGVFRKMIFTWKRQPTPMAATSGYRTCMALYQQVKISPKN